MAKQKIKMSQINNPYAFSAYLNSAQNTANGSIKVLLDAESYDINNNFDKTTNHRFVAPVNGIYHFSFSAQVQTQPSTYFSALLYKNGVSVKNGSLSPPYSYQISTGSGDVYLEAGQYVELYISSVGVYAIGVSNFTTYLDGHLVTELTII